MDKGLKNQIENYRKTNWKKLLREDLGAYHLKEIKPYLDFIKNFIDPFLDSIENIDFLTNSQQQTLKDILERFNNIRQRIESHTDGSQNQNMIGMVINIKNMILESGQPLSWALETKKNYDPKRVSNKPERDVKKYQSVIKKLEASLKEAQEIQTQTQKIQSQYEGQIVSEEASQYGEFFNKEAQNNEKRSWWYGGFVIAVSIFSCWIAYCLFIFDPSIQANSIPELIIKGNLINKIFVFSILLFMISLLSREYMALRHQFTLNRHRHNALVSHKEILTSIKGTESESDKEIANAILLELTKAMFNSQDTGFVKNQKSSSAGDRVIEISKPIFKAPES